MNPEPATRIAIVEDHSVLAHGLSLILRQNGHDVLIPTLDGDTMVDEVRRYRPHVVILDLHLEGAIGDSVPLISPLSADGARVIVLTGETGEAALGACLEAGAGTVAAKSEPLEWIIDLVERAIRGEPLISISRREELLASLRTARQTERTRLAPFARLSTREGEVLVEVLAGRSADEIAAKHVVSIATVRSQIRSILEKLGVASQLQAAAMARNAGWSPDA
jgi:two-component system, NarL family, nitrate/nitrite response regulator NarL